MPGGITGIVIGVAALIVLFFARRIIGGMFGLFRVVPANEANIRILNNKKEIFCNREGYKSCYWRVPFITKVHRIPLCNISVPVADIKLNDSDMAKFVCDIACFINISNIDLATERLILTDVREDMGFDLVKLSEDLRAIMESVGRTVTTKQTILDIYMDRNALDSAITAEVADLFPKWGIQLVDLELKDIKDAPDSTIIADIERKVAADKRRDADIRVAEANRASKLAEAEAEETYKTRQIQRDEMLGLKEQEKNLRIAEQTRLANEKLIEAKRVKDVGTADIERQEIEKRAEAEKQKRILEAQGEAEKLASIGKGEADKIRNIGDAEASIIFLKKEAEAKGTEALAAALKEFDDRAYGVRQMEIDREVALGRFDAFGQALSRADIKWIMSGDRAQKFFGINLDAEGGANLNQFLETALEGVTTFAQEKAVQEAVEEAVSTAKEAAEEKGESITPEEIKKIEEQVKEKHKAGGKMLTAEQVRYGLNRFAKSQAGKLSGKLFG